MSWSREFRQRERVYSPLTAVRILIIGATSPTGILIAREVLSVFRSSTLMLYIEHPDRLPADIASHRNVITVTGKLDDAQMILKCMDGTDVVIAALGVEGFGLHGQPHLPSPLSRLKDVYLHILAAMRHEGVKRIICLLPIYVADPNDRPPVYSAFGKAFFQLLSKEKMKSFDQVGQADDLACRIPGTGYSAPCVAR